MIWFVLGFIAGSGALLLFLGFMAVVTEDEERQEEARRRKAEDKRRMDELMDHYRSYY